MPELPDIELYVEKLTERLRGHTLTAARIGSPFLLRSYDPPLEEAHGKSVTDVRRLGKRVAIGLDSDCWLVLHLMIAGRLHWKATAPRIGGKNQLACFDFDNGHLLLTEAGHKKRASLHFVRGDAGLTQHDPGGIEPLTCSQDEFTSQLQTKNRTLKRALTDPRSISGIGNAYSDEILHAARLSPIKHTQKLNDDELQRLFESTQHVLNMWLERLRNDSADRFPEKVTAFRSEMAIHGKFGKPCPVCAAPVQRIRYKSNETNYCARCQNGGKILADRSLSRLLKDDWPASLDEQE